MTKSNKLCKHNKLHLHSNTHIPIIDCSFFICMCSQSSSQMIDRNMSVSTSQHWTNIQNLRAAKTLSPLISQPTSRPGSSQTTPNPKPRASKRAHLRLRRANRGEGRSIFHKAGPGTQGLAKVNNSASRPIIDGTVPFYTVNRCQTVVERCDQITKDLQHPRITEECLPLILHHLVFDSL